MTVKIDQEERKVAKPSENEIFDMSGPLHLTSVDWSIPEHRRSVAASLVQGVYVLESDRSQQRTGVALAPMWWEFFHFRCIQILVDEVDSSTFGAIFEYNPHTPNYFYPTPPQNNQAPPRYVIAFRGTITKGEARNRDLYLDMQIGLNGLSLSTRYQTAFEAVQGIVASAGPANVWLAGHSLGAAIALQVGKDMAKMGCYIETYLFNPPYVSLPIDKLTSNKHLNGGIRIAKSVVTAGLSHVLKGKTTTTVTTESTSSQQDYDPFTMLCSWIPYLFVNPDDLICCEYIGHFEHRERMEAIGAGKIERIATQNSIRSLVLGGEASHLVPSAFVTKNMVVMKQGLMLAHGLHQWWKPHTCWQSNLYQW